MEEWPAVKLPSEFSGHGFEVIGDPSGISGEGQLWFQDGDFDGFQLAEASTFKSSPARDERAFEKIKRRRLAESHALFLRDHPGSKETADSLKSILKECRSDKPQDKKTERSTNEIKAGGNATDWPAQKKLERAVIIALMETAQQHRRPPDMREVTERAGMLRDSTDEMNQHLARSSPTQLEQILAELGFGWLRRRPRGRPPAS